MRVYSSTLALLFGAVAAAQSPAPAAPIAVPLVGRSLDAAASRLVRVSGTVTAVRTGLGDHTVTLANHVPGAGTASVVVDEPATASLENFEPNDDISVTGVLVRRETPAGAVYSIHPRAASDVASIGWTRATERRATTIVIAVVLLVLVGLGTAHARQDERHSRRRIAATIRESEERYRMLVDESPVGILVHRHGHVLFGNSALAAMLGGDDAADLVGLRLADLVHPIDRSRAIRWFRELRKHRDRAVRAREQFRRLDGAAVDIEIVATNTTFAGKPAVQVVVHDMTARAGLEDHLRQSQKMEAISQLAAGVAHDFNNVLTAIAAYTQVVLDDRSLSEEAQRDVREIQSAGERASSLTKQLLAVSRRQLVLADVIDLNEVIASGQSYIQRTVGERIGVKVSLAEGGCPVFADRSQLEHVITNLVLNARDAMPNGGVLEIETVAREIGAGSVEPMGIEAGEYIALVVRDSGIGMAPDTLRRVFEPFFTTKPASAGAGLGLATMYGIVTGARGHVSAKSAPDEGSEFTVLLPRMSVPTQRSASVAA